MYTYEMIAKADKDGKVYISGDMRYQKSKGFYGSNGGVWEAIAFTDYTDNDGRHDLDAFIHCDDWRECWEEDEWLTSATYKEFFSSLSKEEFKQLLADAGFEIVEDGGGNVIIDKESNDMRDIKVEFIVHTGCACGERKAIRTFTFPIDLSNEDIETKIQKAYVDWCIEQVECYWRILSDSNHKF